MAAVKKNNITKSIYPAIKLSRRVSILIIIIILIPITLGFFARHKPSVTTTHHTEQSGSTTFTSVSGDAYTLSYPTDWSESESAGVKGGSVYYLSPPHADAVVKPHVIFQILDATAENTQRVTESYILLKYHRQTVTISGTTAQKFTAVVPGVRGPFHSIAYVFTNNNKLYFLELGYTQIATDPQLENEFQQMINAFSLH